VAYYANELSINEMKPGDWLVAPFPGIYTTGLSLSETLVYCGFIRNAKKRIELVSDMRFTTEDRQFV